MLKACPRVRRITVLLSIVCLLSLPRGAAAQALMADPPLQHNTNPLCSGSLPCLDIDDFAAHFIGQFQIAPGSQLRDTAVVFPFGIALHLFGLVAGHIFTTYSFWNQGGVLNHQFGPLELGLAGRLYPFHPSLKLEGASDHDDEPPPPSGLQLGLSFQQQVRVNTFSGPNWLGMMSDLAALRLVASRRLWVLDVVGTVGALYTWDGAIVVGEGGLKVGFRLPGFRNLEILGEGIVRGPVYHNDQKLAALLNPSSGAGAMPNPNLLPPQLGSGGCGGLGFAFHVHRRLDVGVTVHRCDGSLGPWDISVNALAVSLADPYKDHPGTSMAELTAEAGREFGRWALKQIQNIDPYLKKDCVLYDENHHPTDKLGELSPDGKACIYQGLRVPIGPHFWHDPSERFLCYDKKATDCFLYRPDRYSKWEAIHPMLIHDDCMAYYKGQPWMRVGNQTADKQGCENQGHVLNVGGELRPDGQVPGYYCYDEPDKAKIQTKKEWCYQVPEHPQVDGLKRYAQGVQKSVAELKHDIQQVQQIGKEMDQGVPLHATTPVQEAIATGERIVDRLGNVTVDDAKDAFDGVVNGARKWINKPPHEQAGDILQGAGEATASPLNYLPVAGAVVKEGVAVVRGAEAVVDGVEVATEAAEAGKKLAQGVKASEHAGHAGAGAVKAERKAARALPPKPEPKGLLPAGPEPVKPPEAGRFIVDEKGNVLIEPKGGFTQSNANGTFVKTHYPNGSSAYQLHEAHPKRGVYESHGHGRAPGHGPDEKDWGPSLDPEGRIVPYNSADAHWKVRK